MVPAVSDFRGPVAGPGRDDSWVSGRQAVKAALVAGRLEKLYLAAGRHLEDLHQLAKEGGVVIEVVPMEALSRLVGGHHQGVAGRIASGVVLSVEDLIAQAFTVTATPLLVALDHLQDPRNLGAIARTAETMGANGLILPRHRAAGLTATAQRTSAGALATLPVARIGNLSQSFDQFRERGGRVVAADPEGEVPLVDADLSGPLMLVVGAEHEGLGPLLLRRVDLRIRIVTRGRTPSLNASVAAAIVLYQASLAR